MYNIVWSPQEKQKTFMERAEYEALYGGAAGGGKSEALVVEALRQVDIPHYKALILRKTYPELRDLIDKSILIYNKAYPEAVYNESKHQWRFPSGAKVIFGSMPHKKDKYKYQGQAFDFVAFDELTHFDLDEYMYLYSRNRPNGPGTRVYIRATANPGGIGHGWVKERFITPAAPMTPIPTAVEIETPTGEKIRMVKKRIFVPATVFDNKELLKNDPTYLASLALLPEAEKKALLYGDWNSFSGQAFTEFRDNPAHYRDQQFTHVIEPFDIPKTWKIYRGYDFGYAKPFSVGWYAVDHDGCIYRINELYGWTGTPNEGIKWDVNKQADEIKRIEAEDRNLKGRRIIGIADPSIFDESRGESIAAQFDRKQIFWSPADNTRIAGKMQLHYRFSFEENGRAMLYVFNICRNFIRTIPALVYSERHPEDINTDGEDHIYDECRYVCMEHPISPRKNVLATQPLKDDPLNMDTTEKQDKYSFYRI